MVTLEYSYPSDRANGAGHMTFCPHNELGSLGRLDGKESVSKVPEVMLVIHYYWHTNRNALVVRMSFAYYSTEGTSINLCERGLHPGVPVQEPPGVCLLLDGERVLELSTGTIGRRLKAKTRMPVTCTFCYSSWRLSVTT